jgi:hypothetical protein
LIVLAPDYMKEVAAGKAEFLWGCGIVVEERSNDLIGGKIAPCQHLSANASRRWGLGGGGVRGLLFNFHAPFLAAQSQRQIWAQY